MVNQTRVKVVMQGKKKGIPGWPHIDYNYDQKATEVLQVLKNRLPDIDFDFCFYTTPKEAQKDFQTDKETYDGLLVLMASNWIGVDLFYCDMIKEGIPTIIADIPHAGSGGFLNVNSRIALENLPIPTVSSLNFNDIADTVQLFEALKNVSKSKILIITDNKNYDTDLLQKARALWGCDFIIKNSADMLETYRTIADQDAQKLADRWIGECIKVLEPSQEEILKSAKFYYALQKLKKENDANAVTVDCLNLFYKGGAPAYPCLSFFEMGRNGEIGVCEADIDATITSLLLLYSTGRTGFVSDPVIDTSSNQIIYDHCVCSNKAYGKDDVRTCPYYLRSHAEDRKGASVQTILPTGEQLTTVKVSCKNKTAAIHSGVSVGNVAFECGCRTKLAAQANVTKILRNWHYEIFSWHRVTIFGDYRTKMENLFKLKGLKLIHEDID
jgi:L-fucose isomerase-like protein